MTLLLCRSDTLPGSFSAAVAYRKTEHQSPLRATVTSNRAHAFLKFPPITYTLANWEQAPLKHRAHDDIQFYLTHDPIRLAHPVRQSVS